MQSTQEDPAPYRKKKLPGHVRVAVVKRYGATPGPHTTPAKCAYCPTVGGIWWPFTFTGRVGTHLVLIGLEFDHVHPESKGGKGSPENLVLACRPCNRAKKDKVL